MNKSQMGRRNAYRIELWPRPKIKLDFEKKSTVEVESFLQSLYVHKGYPVFISSARAGILLVLKHLKTNRVDKIYVFPFASHCVLDAVSRIGRPSASLLDSDLKLINHQMGYISSAEACYRDIEDAVDTLASRQAELFPAGGGFELWSFSKIFGAVDGAVVWCREERDQRMLQDLRDRSKASQTAPLLRYLGHYSRTAYDLWHARAPVLSKANEFVSSQVFRFLQTRENLICERTMRLELFKLKSLLPKNYAPNRYPVAVPIKLSISPREMVGMIEGELGIHLVHGARSITNYKHKTAEECSEALVIPIHSDISLDQIQHILDFTEKWWM